MAKTVIFGGTFNPFHNGHLEIVNILRGCRDVAEVIIIPTATPPHKETDGLVDGVHRYNMCSVATKDFANVSVSDIELKRGGRSYTYDTVTEIGKKHKNVAVACGADMISSFRTWYRYDDLIKKVEIIAFRRVGVDGETFDKAVADIREDGGKIFVLDCSITAVSSTEVRSGDFENVPESVMEYINQNKLYGV